MSNCTTDQANINYYTAAVSVDHTQLEADQNSLAYWEMKYSQDGCGGPGHASVSQAVMDSKKAFAESLNAAAEAGRRHLAELDKERQAAN